MEQVTLNLKTYEALKDSAEGKNKELINRLDTLINKVEALECENEKLRNNTPHVESVVVYDKVFEKRYAVRSFRGIDEIKEEWGKTYLSEIKRLKKKLYEKEALESELTNEIQELKNDRDKWIEIATSKKSLFQRIFGS